MNEWIWFVVREREDNSWVILAGPFTNNHAAIAAARDKAHTFKGIVFVVESTHIAQATEVEYREVKKGERTR